MDTPRNARRLRAQTGRWNQLESCLETLDQTERAMVAYVRNSGAAGTGEHYLALYGLLQAMVLQQDAVCHLEEALGGCASSIMSDRSLQEIRSVRNWSVGHPTKVDRRDVMSHHQISRPKIGSGFELVSAFDDGRRQYTFVNVGDLIRRQKMAIARLLRKLVDQLDSIHPRQQVELKTKAEIIREHRERRTKLGKRQTKPQQIHAQTRHSHPIAMKARAEKNFANIARPAYPQRQTQVHPANSVSMRKKGADRRTQPVVLPDHLERRRRHAPQADADRAVRGVRPVSVVGLSGKSNDSSNGRRSTSQFADRTRRGFDSLRSREVKRLSNAGFKHTATQLAARAASLRELPGERLSKVRNISVANTPFHEIRRAV